MMKVSEEHEEFLTLLWQSQLLAEVSPTFEIIFVTKVACGAETGLNGKHSQKLWYQNISHWQTVRHGRGTATPSPLPPWRPLQTLPCLTSSCPSYSLPHPPNPGWAARRWPRCLTLRSNNFQKRLRVSAFWYNSWTSLVDVKFHFIYNWAPYPLPTQKALKAFPQLAEKENANWKLQSVGKSSVFKLKTQKCLSSLSLTSRSLAVDLETLCSRLQLFFHFSPPHEKNSFFPKRKSKNMKLIFCTAQCFIMPHVLRTYINGNVCERY